jgi:DNA-binding transcriptional ArsR family regulator
MPTWRVVRPGIALGPHLPCDNPPRAAAHCRVPHRRQDLVRNVMVKDMSAVPARRDDDSGGGYGPDAVLRALADPRRRQILRLVRGGELAAGQIAAHFDDITQQGISQHLRVLERAGLLTERRDGTRRLYELRSEALEQVRAMLAELWPDALQRLKAAVEANHPRTGDTDPP